MYHRRQVVLAVSDLTCRQTLIDILKNWGLEATIIATARAALGLLDDPNLAIIFCDAHPGDSPFRELLKESTERRPSPPVVALIRNDREYLEAIQAGAFDAIPVSSRRSDLQWVMIYALRDHRDSATEAAPAENSGPTPWPRASQKQSTNLTGKEIREPDSGAQSLSSPGTSGGDRLKVAKQL
jgi:DNA-binding NtrC family response regulator